MKVDTLLVIRLTAETKDEAMNMPAVHQEMAEKIQACLSAGGPPMQLPPDTQLRFRLIPGRWE